MRSALICVFLTLLKKEDHVAGDVFRPTPIPLDEWRPYDSRGRAGTLHETIETASPTTVVAIPAHYWEDALRHSVYLTLVRDKIDQLIKKGDSIEPEYNHNSHVSKEVDDQDLWDKIKAAPFDRIKEAETTTFGDITILARGRLMEELGGFRITEDDKSHEKCNDDKCMDGVKAFWSVKRVRQRDQEISPGKYHYELTFSVMSQIPRKQTKPYGQPIRTFTVQESTNDRVTESPYAYRIHEKSASQISRPERAIWFHKNIAPTTHQRKRNHQSELDKLFSSIFDYDDDEPNYEAPRKFKQNTYQPSLSSHSKIGYSGGFSSEQHSQIKTLPYPYKPHNFKYQSYPYTTSPMGLIEQYSIEQETGGINNPHITHGDYMSAGFSNVQISTRPAVLPTPLPPLVSTSKESFVKKSNTIKHNMLENITNVFEMATNHKQYNKIKTPGKVNYFPEHLRPPIYNAPPGVFVTMDKKPFKPMPLLKMSATKPLRTNRPIDFRPSPQVLDVQFSEPDPLFDTVFRPMKVNYGDTDNSTKNLSISTESETIKKFQKPNSSPLTSFKKQNNAKVYRTTTNAPEIITAHNSSEEEDVMEWADILGVFAKTTPMESQKSKNKTDQITTPLPLSTTTVTLVSTQITSETPSMTTIPTTLKPKKRTRPPPKFNKTEKIRKHKRVTTTTTTTELPVTTKDSEGLKRKKTNVNLIPQATTTVASTTKLPWKPSTKSTSTAPPSTTSTSTKPNPTTTTKITSTTDKPVESEIVSTLRSKSTNRFRQSTLMVKGTSVKHDRWSVTSPAPEKLRPAISASIHTKRRKGSNFHGYVSSTPKNLEEEQKRHVHIDHGMNNVKFTSPESETKDIEMVSSETPALAEAGEVSLDLQDEQVMGEEKNYDIFEESRDHSEFIFQNISDISNDKNNEVIDTEEILTTEKIVSTPYSIPKNKKCKKKHQNLSTKDETQKNLEKNVTVSTNIPTTSTTTLVTPSMLEDLLNDFSFDDLEQSKTTTTTTTTTKLDLDEEQSETHEQYANDDLEKLLDSLNNDNKYEELADDEYENDDDDEDDENEEDDDIDDDHEKESAYEEEDMSYYSNEDSSHHLRKDDGKRPLTLLELMAME